MDAAALAEIQGFVDADSACDLNIFSLDFESLRAGRVWVGELDTSTNELDFAGTNLGTTLDALALKVGVASPGADTDEVVRIDAYLAADPAFTMNVRSGGIDPDAPQRRTWDVGVTAQDFTFAASHSTFAAALVDIDEQMQADSPIFGE